MTQPRDMDQFATANRFYAAGKFAEAAGLYREIIETRPDFAEAHNNLGNALVAAGNLDEAIESYRQATQLRDNFAEAYHNLGALLQRMKRWGEAAEAYQNAVRLDANLPAEVHNQLGIVLTRTHQRQTAVAAFHRALELRPDFPEALNNLGNVYHQLQQAGEAIACFRRAAALRPDSAEIFNNLGNVYKETGQLDHALAAHHRATELRPTYADAFNNLGNTLKDTRRLKQALACYDKALSLDPTHHVAHSGKVYTLHFHPDSTPQSLAEAHREWSLQHANSLARMKHRNARDANRKLRIGYVSPDFRDHVVGRFLQPLLEHHDHTQFEIYGYASVAHADNETQNFKSLVNVWRDVGMLSDERLAQVINEDEIDILVDLTLHMAGSRLLTFARKPAPVQITYLAYCSTSGLEAIDYRFTDGQLDPLGKDECYVEKSWGLRSYWCYAPPKDAPRIERAPGPLTFGCLNNFCKISDATIAVWGKLLERVPESRLILHAHAGTHRQELLDQFANIGILAERIEFAGFMPLAEYLAMYNRIDIALDPFPYAGGTTTCDALWMGVPVITLAGKTAVARAGCSILSQINLQELIAENAEEYINKAASVAAHKNALKELRVSLRERMQHSPLMDANAFARDVEHAYREMWNRWCGSNE